MVDAVNLVSLPIPNCFLSRRPYSDNEPISRVRTQEEALYWIFLLRSMKRTRSHRTQRITRWLNSRVFWIWLGLALASAVAHLTVPFAPKESSDDDISMRIFLFEGGSAVINV